MYLFTVGDTGHGGRGYAYALTSLYSDERSAHLQERTVGQINLHLAILHQAIHTYRHLSLLPSFVLTGTAAHRMKTINANALYPLYYRIKRNPKGSLYEQPVWFVTEVDREAANDRRGKRNEWLYGSVRHPLKMTDRWELKRRGACCYFSRQNTVMEAPITTALFCVVGFLPGTLEHMEVSLTIEKAVDVLVIKNK